MFLDEGVRLALGEGEVHERVVGADPVTDVPVNAFGNVSADRGGVLLGNGAAGGGEKRRLGRLGRGLPRKLRGRAGRSGSDGGGNAEKGGGSGQWRTGRERKDISDKEHVRLESKAGSRERESEERERSVESREREKAESGRKERKELRRSPLSRSSQRAPPFPAPP